MTVRILSALMPPLILGIIISTMGYCCDPYDLGDLGEKRASQQASQFFNLKKTATNNDLLIFAKQHPQQTSEYLSYEYFITHEKLEILTVLSNITLFSVNMNFDDISPTDPKREDYTDLKYLPLKRRDNQQTK
ncbi:MAG: hypothetical protein K2X98_00995 [Alphaproteobacteria bacterium]|nr:hypothetical protein [Alphaproteobacteria bacterium]